MPIGFGPAALGLTRNGLPLRKRFRFQRALWVFVATGGTVPVSDEVAQGPEALREPRGALWLLAEVEAHWKNNAAGEGNERTTMPLRGSIKTGVGARLTGFDRGSS